MKLTLIGMSNVGKTYWATKLEEEGFTRFYCDGLINKEIAEKFKISPGMNSITNWLGQPYEHAYAQNSKLYLEYEKKVLRQAIDLLIGAREEEDIVIDTSGSVIYTDLSILQFLSQHTKIVYLETPESVISEMQKLYLKEPKPVIWGNSFNNLKGESDMQSIARCYPELLAYRTKQYEKLAGVTLDYYLLREKDFNIDKFIQAINDEKS